MILAQYGKLKYLEDEMAVYRDGVGIFSAETDMKILLMLSKQYACMLSYLKDKIIKKHNFRTKFKTHK